jgi:hypothetical protein
VLVSAKNSSMETRPTKVIHSQVHHVVISQHVTLCVRKLCCRRTKKKKPNYWRLCGGPLTNPARFITAVIA